MTIESSLCLSCRERMETVQLIGGPEHGSLVDVPLGAEMWRCYEPMEVNIADRAASAVPPTRCPRVGLSRNSLVLLC